MIILSSGIDLRMPSSNDYQYNSKYSTQQNFSALMNHHQLASAEQQSSKSEAITDPSASDRQLSDSKSKGGSPYEAHGNQERATSQLENPSFPDFDWTKLHQRDLDAKIKRRSSRQGDRDGSGRDDSNMVGGDDPNKAGGDDQAGARAGKGQEGSSRWLRRSHRK